MAANRLDSGFLWWRARDYVIEHDVLKPTVDPEPYILGPRSTAWKELTDLNGAYSGEQLTPEARREICSWCTRYGLPGYLLQTTHRIWLPAVSNSLRGGRTEQTVVVYERAGGRWITEKKTIGDDDEEGEPGPPGPYVARLERTDLTNKPQPAIVREGFMTYVIKNDVASSWLALAEPNVSERTSISRLAGHLKRAPDYCPQPGTEAFWRIYQEPVEDFFRAARLLAWIKAAGAGDNTLALLNQFSGTGWVVALKDERAWTGPSLLAAFAGEWLTASGFRRCERSDCREPFLPDRTDQVYCKKRNCQNTVAKRRARAHK